MSQEPAIQLGTLIAKWVNDYIYAVLEAIGGMTMPLIVPLKPYSRSAWRCPKCGNTRHHVRWYEPETFRVICNTCSFYEDCLPLDRQDEEIKANMSSDPARIVETFPDVRSVRRHACGCVTGFGIKTERYVLVSWCSDPAHEKR